MVHPLLVEKRRIIRLIPRGLEAGIRIFGLFKEKRSGTLGGTAVLNVNPD
jgi:hypothetical protein